MFERHEVVLDLGDLLIRGFIGPRMVLARISGFDLNAFQFEASVNIPDPLEFVRERADIFLHMFWNKYQNGKRRKIEHHGLLYELVDIDLDDLVAVAKELTPPGRFNS